MTATARPIWACANVDARASREVAELKEIHDFRFESEVYEVSGQTLALSAMPRLLWLAHHRPDIYRQAATVTMISDWLAAKLSGELGRRPVQCRYHRDARSVQPRLASGAAGYGRAARRYALAGERDRHAAGGGYRTPRRSSAGCGRARRW
ncbi:Autoinducer 2 kinase LsrK [Raoultella terrigena]|uniref:Autoinducer 2 kinase LsrK n=1 Tax=Raoultella terrigena TaxID=577 RepID=A0A4V6J206_RAOTE|nr:Autoinducer 2 kinase LsrK [Raoultella terrigena]